MSNLSDVQFVRIGSKEGDIAIVQDYVARPIKNLPEDFVLDGNVQLSGQPFFLAGQLMKKLPDLSKTICRGDCRCSANPFLQTLKGLPKRIVGDLSACICRTLKKLECKDTTVDGRRIELSDNNLVTADGLPKMTSPYCDINLSKNKLSSWAGIPDSHQGFLDVSHNKYESFWGFPPHYQGSIDIKGNPLKSFEDCPDTVRLIYCDEKQIPLVAKSASYIQEKVCCDAIIGECDLGRNISFKRIPKQVIQHLICKYNRQRG